MEASRVPQAREKIYLDVISVGDQLCEITAAIRLSVSNASIIRHTKLLMILDSISDRVTPMSPEKFVNVRYPETRFLYVNFSTIGTLEDKWHSVSFFQSL